MTTAAWKPDPKLDLVLERDIDVPPELVWKALTQPEHLKQWFCPKPWYVSECTIDLRPSGMLYALMRGPAGEQQPMTVCYLEVVPNRRLVWTDALLPGYRPAEKPFMTAVITLEPKGKGTRYSAIAIHKDPATRAEHEKMGFHEGWGTALTQMVELVKGMK